MILFQENALTKLDDLLNVVIPHFDNYPLQSAKVYRTPEGLTEEIAIKAALNLWLTEKLKAAFPILYIVPFCKDVSNFNFNHLIKQFLCPAYFEDLLKYHRNLLKDEAKKFLKGCPQHFRQSVSRISRNHAIIDCTLSSNFTSMTLKLLTINNKEFYNRVKSLQGKWPKANSWLEWWIYTDAGPMLFPALSTMNKDLSNLLPTTNAQESMHHCYCLSGATQQSIITMTSNINKVGHDISSSY
ncbi:13802_t:CDS:2 [Entrophospora sp. SA101]|nr:13802_t:CDS:2 [Entrophospora sp. SA101]